MKLQITIPTSLEEITLEQYQIASLMYEGIFNQDVYKTLEFKETITAIRIIFFITIFLGII